MATRFDLVIDASPLRPERLRAFLDELGGFVSEMDKSFSTDGRASLELVITSLSYNSPVRIGYSARPRHHGRDRSRRVLHACSQAIKAIESGQPVPEGVSDEALGHLQRLAAENNREEIRSVRFEVPRDKDFAEVTAVGALNAARILRHELSFGSIEGRAEGLNIHNAELRFTVYDAVSGQGVICWFDAADFKRVKDIIGNKVIVTGTIRRDADGHPREIRPLRSFEAINEPPRPQLSSPVGLFAGLGDSRSYLEMIRGE